MVGVVLCTVWACDVRDEPAPRTPEKVSPSVWQDAILEPERARLLDLAFRTATAVPVDPHIKDRSRLQEEVAAVGLQLGQYAKVADYAEQIGDWRRGSVYADLASAAITLGQSPRAMNYLNRADEIAQAVGLADWRRDRIRIKIAAAYAKLGDVSLARSYQSNISLEFIGSLELLDPETRRPASFELQVQTLDQLVASETFELIKNALNGYVRLYGQHYGDPSRRALLVEKFNSARSNIPAIVQFEVVSGMFEAARRNGDMASAKEWVHEARALVEKHQWPVEYHVPLLAKLAVLDHASGETQRARLGLESAVAIFDSQRDSVPSMDRAGMLRHVAEAHQRIGESAQALRVYRRVVEEGRVNPNARPRAMDLSATCRSMALHGALPDAALWALLDRTFTELRAPW